MQYRVMLNDCPAPQEKQEAAIAKFRRVFERKLGSELEATYQAFQKAEEASAKLKKDVEKGAKRWKDAFMEATKAGSQELGEAANEETYFEVKVS